MHWKRKYDNYNCSAFYEPSYVIARAYQNGRFSFGGEQNAEQAITENYDALNAVFMGE